MNSIKLRAVNIQKKEGGPDRSVSNYTRISKLYMNHRLRVISITSSLEKLNSLIFNLLMNAKIAKIENDHVVLYNHGHTPPPHTHTDTTRMGVPVGTSVDLAPPNYRSGNGMHVNQLI